MGIWVGVVCRVDMVSIADFVEVMVLMWIEARHNARTLTSAVYKCVRACVAPALEFVNLCPPPACVLLCVHPGDALFALMPPPPALSRECTSNGDVEKAGWELLTLKYLQGDPMFAGTALHLPLDLAPLAAAMAQVPEEVSRIAGIVGQQCKDHIQGSLVSDDAFWYLCKKGEHSPAGCTGARSGMWRSGRHTLGMCVCGGGCSIGV